MSCYDHIRNVIAELYEKRIITAHELLFVDDGSTDKTLTLLKGLAAQDGHVFYISFTRNFGKESAILAGLVSSMGDYVTLMDADLQDPPELLKKMFGMIQNGYECAAARRSDRRGEPFVRSFFARLFYRVINYISDVEIVDGVRDFRLMTRRMVDALLTLKEKGRFSKGLFPWTGYRTYYIDYPNTERSCGGSKWSFWKLVRYSLDGITAFSVLPLQIASVAGILCCISSMLGAVYIVVQKLLIGIDVEGYALLMCSVFLLGGLQLLGLGIIGQYMGKMFTEIKNRPDYVVYESNLKAEATNRVHPRRYTGGVIPTDIILFCLYGARNVVRQWIPLARRRKPMYGI